MAMLTYRLDSYANKTGGSLDKIAKGPDFVPVVLKAGGYC
jgi:hypothetical protein